MWTTTWTGRTAADADAVWAALVALHTGTALGPGSDDFRPHGPLAVGTAITVTPQGQQPMTSMVVELEPGERYADRTAFDGLALTFRHVLRREQDGGTQVSHTLEIDGDGADRLGPALGPQISGDFPVAMAELLAAAERGARG